MLTMTNKHNKILGNFGEDAACNYLKNKGYTIVARNYSIRGGEIDIIAQSNNCLTFVEVKTRQTADFGVPAEAVDYRKIEKIRHVIEHYLSTADYNGDIRADVVEVYGTLELGRFLVSEINHIENIIS